MERGGSHRICYCSPDSGKGKGSGWQVFSPLPTNSEMATSASVHYLDEKKKKNSENVNPSLKRAVKAR